MGTSTVVVPALDQLGVHSLAPAIHSLASQAQADLNSLFEGGAGTDTGLVHLVTTASTANIASLTSASVTIDGVTLVAGQRVLLKNQSTGSQNGIYVVGTVTGGNAPLTRAADLPSGAILTETLLVAVNQGTANANTIYQMSVATTSGHPVVDTDALTFGLAATALTAGAGVTIGSGTVANKDNGVAGTALTDAAAAIAVAGGYWYTLPASTLSTARTATLGTAGAVAGDQITITRLDTSANTYTIANGGGGGGNVAVMPVSKAGFVVAQFDGTNWACRALGSQ